MSQVETVEERVAREDLVMFINACFACTGQREFYGGASGQQVSIRFLHRYILGNYRRLYARTLSAGINHFNQGQIVINLLATGKNTRPEDREEESALITASLAALPVQRVYRIFEALRDARVNNRRTRAIIRSYISTRDQVIFDAIKYRSRVRTAVAHAHLKFDAGVSPEVGHFLFHGWKNQKFQTELFETYRQAHYSQKAVYRLPYTVAVGLAAKHGIPRDEFLAGIAENMSANEKLRAMKATKAAGVELKIDLGRAGITRLAVYIASLPPAERAEREEELHEALNRSATRALRRSPRKLGRVCAILDRSHSSSGSSEKRKRPFALALAASYLLRHAADEYRAFWTPSLAGPEVTAHPQGQSDIAHPLLDALRFQPDLVVIISDGYENSPPGAATQVVRALRRCVPGGERISIVHLNPVFDSQTYAPKSLGPDLPTVGIRSAEDILTMLSFARFAAGTAPLCDLEDYLVTRMTRFLQPRTGARS